MKSKRKIVKHSCAIYDYENMLDSLCCLSTIVLYCNSKAGLTSEERDILRQATVVLATEIYPKILWLSEHVYYRYKKIQKRRSKSWREIQRTMSGELLI